MKYLIPQEIQKVTSCQIQTSISSVRNIFFYYFTALLFSIFHRIIFRLLCTMFQKDVT